MFILVVYMSIGLNGDKYSIPSAVIALELPYSKNAHRVTWVVRGNGVNWCSFQSQKGNIVSMLQPPAPPKLISRVLLHVRACTYICDRPRETYHKSAKKILRLRMISHYYDRPHVPAKFDDANQLNS